MGSLAEDRGNSVSDTDSYYDDVGSYVRMARRVSEVMIRRLQTDPHALAFRVSRDEYCELGALVYTLSNMAEQLQSYLTVSASPHAIGGVLSDLSEAARLTQQARATLADVMSRAKPVPEPPIANPNSE